MEQKLAILRDAFGPEGSVRAACDRHEVGSGAVYTWRRQAMSGELTGVRPSALPAFFEVEIADPVVRGDLPPGGPSLITRVLRLNILARSPAQARRA